MFLLGFENLTFFENRWVLDYLTKYYLNFLYNHLAKGRGRRGKQLRCLFRVSERKQRLRRWIAFHAINQPWFPYFPTFFENLRFLR